MFDTWIPIHCQAEAWAGSFFPTWKSSWGPPHAHTTPATRGSCGYVHRSRLSPHISWADISVLHAMNTSCILAWCHTAFVQTAHLFHLLLAPPPQKLQSPQSIWSSPDFASAWVFSLVYSPSPPACLHCSRAHFSRSKNRLELIIIPGLRKLVEILYFTL